MVGPQGGARSARPSSRTTRPGDVMLPDGTAAWIDGGPARSARPRGARRRGRPRGDGRARPARPSCPEPVAVTAALAPDQLAAVAHGAGPGPHRRARRARARPACSPSGCATSSSIAASSATACSRSRTTRRRSSSWRSARPTSRPGSARSTRSGYRLLGDFTGRRAAGARRARRAPDRRRPRAARADPRRTPTGSRRTSRGSPRSGSACATRRRSRPSATTCPGLADAFGPLPRRARARGRGRLRRAGLPARSRCCCATAGSGAGCRPGTATSSSTSSRTSRPAHVLLLRLLAAPGLDGVRGRRRRPGHLRPRGRGPRVPHRLRAAVPRRGVAPARGELPLPGRGRRRGQAPARLQPRPGPEGDPARVRTPTPPPTRSWCTRHPAEAGAATARRRRAGLARRRRRRRRDRGADPRELAAARAARRAGRGRASRCASTVARRHARAHRGPRRARPTSGWARCPTQLRPDDLQEVQRRPSRGLPAVDLEVAVSDRCRSTTCAGSPTGSTT